MRSGTTGADDKHPCGKGVERAGMAHFEFLDAKSALNHSSDTLDGVKRSPAERLVNPYDFSTDKIHRYALVLDLKAHSTEHHHDDSSADDDAIPPEGLESIF